MFKIKSCHFQSVAKLAAVITVLLHCRLRLRNCWDFRSGLRRRWRLATVARCVQSAGIGELSVSKTLFLLSSSQVEPMGFAANEVAITSQKVSCQTFDGQELGVCVQMVCCRHGCCCGRLARWGCPSEASRHSHRLRNLHLLRSHKANQCRHQDQWWLCRGTGAKPGGRRQFPYHRWILHRLYQ